MWVCWCSSGYQGQNIRKGSRHGWMAQLQPYFHLHRRLPEDEERRCFHHAATDGVRGPRSKCKDGSQRNLRVTFLGVCVYICVWKGFKNVWDILLTKLDPKIVPKLCYQVAALVFGMLKWKPQRLGWNLIWLAGFLGHERDRFGEKMKSHKHIWTQQESEG